MNIHEQNLFMVFDVESIGLHGEGFAVGYTVVDRKGLVQGEGVYSCDPKNCLGTHDNHQWVKDNVTDLGYHEGATQEVRFLFWQKWLGWKERGAVLVADCCWPVEARFLAACVDDCHQQNDWDGPYPLIDLASTLFALGEDPLAARDRQMNELPIHNPLADARQSARLLVEALKKIDGAIPVEIEE